MPMQPVGSCLYYGNGRYLTRCTYTLPESCFKYLLPNLGLNAVHGFSQRLGDGLTLEGVHVEAARLGREDEKRHHGDVGVARLEVVVESCQCLDEEVCPLVGKLVPALIAGSGTLIRMQVKHWSLHV